MDKGIKYKLDKYAKKINIAQSSNNNIKVNEYTMHQLNYMTKIIEQRGGFDIVPIIQLITDIVDSTLRLRQKNVELQGEIDGIQQAQQAQQAPQQIDIQLEFNNSVSYDTFDDKKMIQIVNNILTRSDFQNNGVSGSVIGVIKKKKKEEDIYTYTFSYLGNFAPQLTKLQKRSTTKRLVVYPTQISLFDRY
jgi:hypothetical protein